MTITNKQKEKQRKELTNAHNVYRKGLSSYASYKVSNNARSEDLVQETFLKTWKYLVKGGKIELMKAFLYHVLNDLIVDEYRKNKTISLDILLKKGFDPGFDSTEKLISTIDDKKIILLIKSLPKKYQKIIFLRYIKDLSINEIADKTKQSKNAVSVQINRGLEKLKFLYDKPK